MPTYLRRFEPKSDPTLPPKKRWAKIKAKTPQEAATHKIKPALLGKGPYYAVIAPVEPTNIDRENIPIIYYPIKLFINARQ